MTHTDQTARQKLLSILSDVRQGSMYEDEAIEKIIEIIEFGLLM